MKHIIPYINESKSLSAGYTAQDMIDLRKLIKDKFIRSSHTKKWCIFTTRIDTKKSNEVISVNIIVDFLEMEIFISHKYFIKPIKDIDQWDKVADGKIDLNHYFPSIKTLAKIINDYRKHYHSEYFTHDGRVVTENIKAYLKQTLVDKEWIKFWNKRIGHDLTILDNMFDHIHNILFTRKMKEHWPTEYNAIKMGLTD